MTKVPQKLVRKKAESYKNAPVSKFGERKTTTYSTMGRDHQKIPINNFARSLRGSLPDTLRTFPVGR
jgi:hypothetical protein